MSVTPLLREEKITQNALYAARKHYGLTLSQAAAALRMTATQVERDELRAVPSTDLAKACRAFGVFVATNPTGNNGKNLLLQQVPVRTLRDVQGISVESIAGRYGVSASQWRKYECHARELPVELREQLEADLLSSFAGVCSRA